MRVAGLQLIPYKVLRFCFLPSLFYLSAKRMSSKAGRSSTSTSTFAIKLQRKVGDWESEQWTNSTP